MAGCWKARVRNAAEGFREGYWRLESSLARWMSKKLGAAGRKDLVRFAIEAGLVADTGYAPPERGVQGPVAGEAPARLGDPSHMPVPGSNYPRQTRSCFRPISFLTGDRGCRGGR